MLLANGTRGLFDGDTLDRTGDLLSLPLLGTILAFQYSASFGLSKLMPLIFIKLGILPASHRTLALSQMKRNYLWGTVITVIPVAIILLSHDASLYKKVQGTTSFTILWLPLPLALPVLVLMDIGTTFMMVVSRCKLHYRNQHCCSKMSFIVRGAGCIVITLFCQILAFHIGWLFPLLIAFPMKVGTLVVMYVCYLLTLIFVISGTVHFFTAHGMAKIMHNEYSGLGWLSLSGLCLASIYYYTQGSNDDGSRDGIATTMVNLFPILVFGVLTWIFRKYRTAEEGSEVCAEILQEKNQSRSDIGKFYHKQLNDLPV